MKLTGVFVVLALLFAAPSHGQDCNTAINRVQFDVWDIKHAFSLIFRQQLEAAVDKRVKETFAPVTDPLGGFYCSTETPAASLSLNEVDGVPEGVSGPARCALYCQNLDGCTSFNFFRRPLIDGSQCQLFKSASTACKVDANCQHFEASGQKRSCRPTTGFTFLPGTKTYYKPVFESLTWAEAQDRCHALSPFAHLAVFKSMAEYTELTSFLRTFPASQAWACSTNVGFGLDWSGWWVAKRKLTDDAPDHAACRASPMVQALDTKLTQVLPEQSWESKMFLGGMPDCSAYWRKSLQWEMCMAIPVNHLYLLNDMMCDYKQCAVCQLDVE